MNDLKYALRQLWKQPGFTAVAVLVLALGIGANSAIFTLINTFLLKPIVAHEPERLVGIYSQDQTRPGSWRTFSHPNFADLRKQQDLFEDVFAMNPSQVGVTVGDTTRKHFAMNVSANYFSVFGAPVQRGRDFLPEEETQPAPVVIVSDRWWRTRGADPDLIGRSVTINGRPFTVVGIAAAGFCGTVPTFAPDFYFPLSFGVPTTGENPLLNREKHSLMLVGRLKSGVSIEDANARLPVVSAQMAAAHPEANKDQVLSVATLPRMAISTNPQNDRRNLGAISALLLGMAAAVLFIACLNLANMLLARSLARRKEIAVRLALGANRWRILRQLLTEGALLALGGGVLGLTLAVWATGWLAGGLSQIAPNELSLDVLPDWRVVLATMTFSLLATLFFALGPALRLTRIDVNHDLKEQAGEDEGGGRRGLLALKNLLVVAQVALSLALLVAAGLFGRGAFNAMQVNPGFDFDRGFYLELDAGLVGYDEPKTRQRFTEILDRVGGLSGVESVSYGVTIPFGDMNLGEGVQQAGAPVPPPRDAKSPAEGASIGANFNVVGPDYFRTLGVSLLQGRDFTRREFSASQSGSVAIINTALANRLWPGEAALGKRIQFARGEGPGGSGPGTFLSAEAKSPATLEVVGLVPPQLAGLFEERDMPMVYVPYGQDFRSSLLLHVRVAPMADLEETLKAVRETVRRVDPVLPVLSAKTLRYHLSHSIQIWIVRMGALMFGTFGAVALLLSMIGVYGVKAYSVARRTREIGIRMALGAGRGQVLGQVLREGAVLIGLGLLLGLAAAALAAKVMGRFLFEVKPFDPVIFLVAPTMLALAALVACWLPARRAARVDPMVALRSE